jgi:hypothetical protein
MTGLEQSFDVILTAKEEKDFGDRLFVLTETAKLQIPIHVYVHHAVSVTISFVCSFPLSVSSHIGSLLFANFSACLRHPSLSWNRL